LRKTASVALLALALLVVSFAGTASAAPAASKASCAPGQLQVSTGCVGRRGARRHIEAMVREAMRNWVCGRRSCGSTPVNSRR
jgi:hypothetical protein